ncbi:MAG: antibiotic ABC transporter permease, partial [Staphylococcus capitis]
QYGDKNTGFFARMIPILIGFVVFFFVFLISGMALLKERTSGTLDRLLATPVKRSEIVYGYMLSYGIIAIFQTAVVVLAAIWLLDVEVVGNILNVIIVNVVLALVALAFGILLSTLAKSEFQMITYSGDAISQIILYGHNLGDILPNLGVLMIFLIILTILNIVGLRRYRKV